MKQKFYVMSALSILCVLLSRSVHGCPLCVDAAGNVNKPFFYEDEEGHTLGEKGCLCSISNNNNSSNIDT